MRCYPLKSTMFNSCLHFPARCEWRFWPKRTVRPPVPKINCWWISTARTTISSLFIACLTCLALNQTNSQRGLHSKKIQWTGQTLWGGLLDRSRIQHLSQSDSLKGVQRCHIYAGETFLDIAVKCHSLTNNCRLYSDIPSDTLKSLCARYEQLRQVSEGRLKFLSQFWDNILFQYLVSTWPGVPSRDQNSCVLQ